MYDFITLCTPIESFALTQNVQKLFIGLVFRHILFQCSASCNCASFTQCARKCQDLTHSIIQHVKSESRKTMPMTSSSHTNFVDTLACTLCHCRPN